MWSLGFWKFDSNQTWEYFSSYRLPDQTQLNKIHQNSTKQHEGVLHVRGQLQRWQGRPLISKTKHKQLIPNTTNKQKPITTKHWLLYITQQQIQSNKQIQSGTNINMKKSCTCAVNFNVHKEDLYFQKTKHKQLIPNTTNNNYKLQQNNGSCIQLNTNPIRINK